MLHDVRFGIRNLVRRPGFALTALVLLALGAGANAAVFSVVRGVLLRPLPFSAPDQLVAVWPDEFVSNDDIGFWRERSRTLSAIASVSPGWLMALVGRRRAAPEGHRRRASQRTCSPCSASLPPWAAHSPRAKARQAASG